MRHPAERYGFIKASAQNDEPCQSQQSFEASFK